MCIACFLDHFRKGLILFTITAIVLALLVFSKFNITCIKTLVSSKSLVASLGLTNKATDIHYKAKYMYSIVRKCQPKDYTELLELCTCIYEECT